MLPDPVSRIGEATICLDAESGKTKLFRSGLFRETSAQTVKPFRSETKMNPFLNDK